MTDHAHNHPMGGNQPELALVDVAPQLNNEDKLRELVAKINLCLETLKGGRRDQKRR